MHCGIYNLDEVPVKVSKFEELESIKYYYDFFSQKLHKM